MRLKFGRLGVVTSAIAAMGICFSIAFANADSRSELPVAFGCTSSDRKTDLADPPVAAGTAFPPVQLDVSTPFEPTAMLSGGRTYLFYELHLANFSDKPLVLRGLDVRNASGTKESKVVTLGEEEMSDRLLPVGVDSLDDHKLGAGQSAVVFMCLVFDANTEVPKKIRHRVLLQDAMAEGPIIGTHSRKLQTLGRPLTGSDWYPADGPSLKSHHRTGIFVAGGRAQISRRYAIDWKIVRQRSSFAGDARDVHAYYAYGTDVLAVASGKIVLARDGLPDNIPRTPAGFETAVPITLETVAGNTVVLDMGDDQFAIYAHLKPGSLRVKQGDLVRRGEILAQIGNSGDAREPHLHFQLSNTRDILASEGLPYVINRYRAKGTGSDWETRTREFPLGDINVDFGAP